MAHSNNQRHSGHIHKTPLTRRAFLKALLTCGAGATIAPWLAPALPGLAHPAETLPTLAPSSYTMDVANVTHYRWRQNAIASWQSEAPAPTDDPATQLVLVSNASTAQQAFTTVVPSWTAQTPPGTWLEIQLRARIDERWTDYYRLMRWDNMSTYSRRTSFSAQANSDGFVNIDTLVLQQPAQALQVRVLLCSTQPEVLPTLQQMQLCMSARPSGANCSVAPLPSFATTPNLALPLFSQYDYANGAGWCSPTALAMVLGYWYFQTGDLQLAPFVEPSAVPTYTAPMVYDPNYRGNGNWPFNTAYAATHGLDACVTQLDNVAQLGEWAAAGVPVICSLAWGPGQLDGASGPSSEGHLLVIVGVRDGWWVEVADPSGTYQNGGILRTLRADQFTKCWQCASAGTVYLLHPYGWNVPTFGIDDPGSTPDLPAPPDNPGDQPGDDLPPSPAESTFLPTVLA